MPISQQNRQQNRINTTLSSSKTFNNTPISLNMNSFSFAHYSRVAYYRLWKPRVWRLFVQNRVTNTPLASFSTSKPLFFNAEVHAVLAQAISNTLSPEDIYIQADNAVNHRFAFFTEMLRDHGESINWQKDYASARDYANGEALKPAHELNFMQSEHGSDVKYAWELSRCQWFTWLGMAHLLDVHNKRYAQAFERDVRSWIAENPLGMGINWTMPMEVAIRASNWILAHSFFHTSSALSDEFWQVFTRSLWQHGKFLSYNLEYVRNNANHFISNAMGLVIIGAFFYHRRTGRQWFRTGKRFLEREILQQFTKDGVNYEKSTAYHRFIVEMLTVSSLCAERVQSSFSNKFYERLSAATGYMAAYMRTDGSAPMVGDADNGRVFRFIASEDFNNHLSIMLLSSVHCKRPQYVSGFAPTGQIFTLENTTLNKQFEQHNSNTSTDKIIAKTLTFTPEMHFVQSGYIIHKTEDTHLFIDAGDYGMNGWGGHGHNDCLSFEFWLRGQTIFTDSGTGAYTSNKALRNELRSTKAHNTLMVGRKEQVEWLESSLWRIKHDDLDPSVLELRSGKQGTAHTFYLLAEHSAYKQRFGVQHRRGIRFNGTGESGELVVIDELIPFEQAMIGIGGTAYFHLPSEIIPHQTAENIVTLEANELTLSVTAKSPITVERCRISRFYGDVRESWCLGVECSLDARSEVRVRW